MSKSKLSKSPLAADPPIDVEEGEVQVYDSDNYLVTDGQTFEFHTSKDQKLNWRQINEFYRVISGNEYPRHGIDASSVAEQHILNNLESISTCDLRGDRNNQSLSHEGR